MAGIGHNRKPAPLELDREMLDFLIENCEANTQLILAMLQNGDFKREGAEKLVKMNEKFRELRRLAMQARGDD